MDRLACHGDALEQDQSALGFISFVHQYVVAFSIASYCQPIQFQEDVKRMNEALCCPVVSA